MAGTIRNRRGLFTKEPIHIRFWRKVRKTNECWLWTGCKDRAGYGIVSFEGKAVRASRLAWFLETGNWPLSYACHKCDNPACVRFSHLFDGDNSANVQDMMRKGRHVKAWLGRKQTPEHVAKRFAWRTKQVSCIEDGEKDQTAAIGT